MNKIFDKSILFTLCIIIYLSNTVGSQTIIFILTALSIGNACGYFENKYVRIGFQLLYFLIACFYFDACFFIPYIIYDSFFRWEKHISFLYLIPCVIHNSQLQPIHLLMILTLSVCSYYLHYRTHQYESLITLNKRIKDDSEELKILQEQKHKQLLEKQDYEIQLAKAEERNRIAREIHDSVGHNLSSSLLQIGAMIAINKDDALKQPLQDMKHTLSEGMNSIRNSVHDLHQDNLVLKEEMQKLIDHFNKCTIQLQYSGSNIIDLRLKYCFLNILKEALNNITKHSNCSKVEIIFIENPKFYQFTIYDNGTNIQVKDGLGLKSMHERVHQFNGICNITYEKGFRIFINIPKEEHK